MVGSRRLSSTPIRLLSSAARSCLADNTSPALDGPSHQEEFETGPMLRVLPKRVVSAIRAVLEVRHFAANHPGLEPSVGQGASTRVRRSV